MKIRANDFNGNDVRLSLEPENEAEKHQLKWLRSELLKHSGSFGDWNDGEGSSGICVVVEKSTDA